MTDKNNLPNPFYMLQLVGKESEKEAEKEAEKDLELAAMIIMSMNLGD